jgi:hypothetical protein
MRSATQLALSDSKKDPMKINRRAMSSLPYWLWVRWMVLYSLYASRGGSAEE